MITIHLGHFLSGSKRKAECLQKVWLTLPRGAERPSQSRWAYITGTVH